MGKIRTSVTLGSASVATSELLVSVKGYEVLAQIPHISAKHVRCSQINMLAQFDVAITLLASSSPSFPFFFFSFCSSNLPRPSEAHRNLVVLAVMKAVFDLLKQFL